MREGKQYFRMMVENYVIVPNVKHYVCRVDLLGRSGHLDEAGSGANYARHSRLDIIA